jgi:hypothetical protein
MVIAKPAWGKYLHFSAFADLCKEMSTKSNDNAGVEGANRRTGAVSPAAAEEASDD